MIRNTLIYQILVAAFRTLVSLKRSGLALLIPLTLGLFLLGVLLFAVQLVSPVAPFVYSLF